MMTMKEQLEGNCVHFNGIQNDTCKAGVCYKETGRPLPCLKAIGEFSTACGKRQWPTVEQVREEMTKIEAYTKRFGAIQPIISKIKKQHKGQSWGGIEECPICKGRLHVSHAGWNGHVHGKCETKDCVSWME